MDNSRKISAVRFVTMPGYILILVSLAVVVTALPLDDPVVFKLDQERFQYIQDTKGDAHLVDLWVKASDLRKSATYNPDTQNVYHLFTRANPSVSQPILLNYATSLQQSNYSGQRRTVLIIHGWGGDASSGINSELVPTFLAAEDANVFIVDWGAGAINQYVPAVINTVVSGESVARFINWLTSVTGTTPASFHIVGYSLGGHQAGITGRNLVSPAAYITSLDPAGPGWITNPNRFRANDGTYTEVIHTNSGIRGYLAPLGHVDFYPNGGVNMPGCDSHRCSHARTYFYFAESIRSGGFTGTQCQSYLSAINNGNCALPGRLNMGGIEPKTGQSGIYYLETNAAPPFSRG